MDCVTASVMPVVIGRGAEVKKEMEGMAEKGKEKEEGEGQGEEGRGRRQETGYRCWTGNDTMQRWKTREIAQSPQTQPDSISRRGEEGEGEGRTEKEREGERGEKSQSHQSVVGCCAFYFLGRVFGSGIEDFVVRIEILTSKGRRPDSPRGKAESDVIRLSGDEKRGEGRRGKRREGRGERVRQEGRVVSGPPLGSSHAYVPPLRLGEPQPPARGPPPRPGCAQCQPIKYLVPSNGAYGVLVSPPGPGGMSSTQLYLRQPCSSSDLKDLEGFNGVKTPQTKSIIFF